MDDFIGVIFGLAAGLLFVLAGFPLMRRMIGPNRWYGYRSRSTLRDEHVWYAVNAQTGKQLTMLGGLLIICGVFGLSALHDPRQQEMLAVTCIAVIILALGYSLLSGWRASRTVTVPGRETT